MQTVAIQHIYKGHLFPLVNCTETSKHSKRERIFTGTKFTKQRCAQKSLRSLAVTRLMNQLTLAVILIFFYEERNFQGRHYECGSDFSDFSSYFNRCNSIRVEGGNWILYEHPSYRGHQYYLWQGEYPDFQRWMGFNDSIRSCRFVPNYHGQYKMRIYERGDFQGQMMEFFDDCPNTYDRFRFHDIHSCNVFDGHWMFYEEPNYRGRQYYLRSGEYRRFNDWGASSPRIGSFRRVYNRF
ncbi:hypothetical protein XELAEV_18006415mg [Xenopus laevis]|uniref:Beta/gamma crystallin 'Greek key' domain-containing protein n=2 Tax=Xenopus laevis TaxID=8355 RepID=A0A974I4A5_XENLA|nr:hypothetical protein XELAEV_18006415mg [Xenopus laevis]